MSLKNIKLDPFLIAGLYKQPLIPVLRNTPSLPEKQEKPALFLGNNLQKVAILIYNKNEDFLSDPLFTFLTQILKACNLSIKDVALINMADLSESELKELILQVTSQKVILFSSIIPEMFPDSHPKNQLWEMAECQYLYTDPLEDLYKNKQMKAAFWKALKQLFRIK